MTSKGKQDTEAAKSGMRKKLSSGDSLDDDASLASDMTDKSRSQSKSADSYGDRFDGDRIAAAENKQVLLSKLVMFAVFFMAAFGVGYATFAFTRKTEEEDYKASFEGFANEIIQVSQLNANKQFQALKSLALSATSSAIGSQDEWPFVNLMPSFYFEGQYTLEQMGASWIVQFPIIHPEERADWETYAVNTREWRNETWLALGQVGPPPQNVSECIFRFNYTDWSAACDDGVFDPDLPFYAPTWGVAVPQENGLPGAFTNHNAWADPIIPPIVKEMFRTGEGVLSEAFGSSLYGAEFEGDVMPDSYLVMPIYDSHDPDAKIVSFLTAAMTWSFFSDILSGSGADGIIMALENPCGSSFTFRIDGPKVTFLGTGDLHDPAYSHLGIAVNATDIRTPEQCRYLMHLYPSKDFEDHYRTNQPIIFTVGAVLIFVITAMFFALYDCLVQKRQNKVMTSATRTGAMVNAMFPKNVRDRMMMDEDLEAAAGGEAGKNVFGFPMAGKRNGDGVQDPNEASPLVFHTKPIADYYPEGTIMVADLVGFTAWSSEREPAQVFILLETLFNGFDKLGHKRKIFKVETFGDCYVAAAGAPEPMSNHAVAMCRYANDCRREMTHIVHKMEVFLGPDTGDLKLKVGISSGAITGGVLRGAKSRFQLFGDTMDNAFLLEESGMPGRIHLNQATADLLKAAGKSKWLVPSGKSVAMKGHSENQTYWLKIHQAPKVSKTNLTEDDSSDNHTVTSYSLEDQHVQLDDAQKISSADKKQRLVEWNVDNLTQLLKKIVAMRDQEAAVENCHVVPSANPLNELKEIITLGNEKNAFKVDPSSVQLPQEATQQLRDYVSAIADLYRDNPFHSFEHACHVTQAITKLLSRVVSTEAIDTTTMTYKQKAASEDLHDNTFGLTSDPMIQFACALSALIHDADHPGVPNATLVKEKADVAVIYNNKSCAEQRSVDLGWNLLMKDEYKDLRNCIYTNQAELERFRQLVVNSVMATDIVDKELGALRKGRWNKAFSTEDGDDEETEKDQVDRKATIVIEHLIQAADVSHMMQHWNVYRKWNELFFRECYKGYLDGRAENDPSEGWYEGEKGFYDFYVIPLAKKLATCGVFGVSSDEFLNYAVANRKKWEVMGREVVQEYIANFKALQEQEQQEQQEEDQKQEEAPSATSNKSWAELDI